MKYKNYLQKLCLLLLPAALLVACSEKVDTSARYVFKYDTAMSYLQKHEAYSTYVELLGKVPVSKMSSSTVGQLLSARGNYTVFAPTNEAIESTCRISWQRIPRCSLILHGMLLSIAQNSTPYAR